MPAAIVMTSAIACSHGMAATMKLVAHEATPVQNHFVAGLMLLSLRLLIDVHAAKSEQSAKHSHGDGGIYGRECHGMPGKY